MRGTRLACLRLLAAVLVVAALGGGCATDETVISQARSFHTQLAPAVVDETEDAVLTAYLQQVGDRVLVAAADLYKQGYVPKSSDGKDNRWMFSKEMKFHFVNSKTLNAFTTGGEHMYIYSELFVKAGNEAELAAVMAHEFAHVYARHVQQGMDRQLVATGVALGAGAAGYALADEDNREKYAAYGAGSAMLIGQFVGMGYTRKDEDEADKLGFQMYVRAGYPPEQFADFFKRMIDMGYDKAPAMLSDHPTLASRVESTKRRIGELPPDSGRWLRPPVADAARFSQLQARAKALAKTMPDDKSLEQTQELLAAMPRSCLTPAVHEDQFRAEMHVRQRMGQQVPAK
jgi:predicted Zn-dependent protease